MAVSKRDLDHAQNTLAQIDRDLRGINADVRIYYIALPAGSAHGWMIEYFLEPQGHMLMSGATLNDAYIRLAHKLIGTEPPPF